MPAKRPDQLIQNYNDVIEGQPEYLVVEILAGSVDNHVFIAPRNMRVKSIQLIPRVIGSDGGAVTAMVTRTQGTEAPASGDDLQVATFDLKGTADTVQTAALTVTTADLDLVSGDRLSLNVTGTLTAVVASLTIEVFPVKNLTDTPA